MKNGGIIGPKNNSSILGASGIWGIGEQLDNNKKENWPTGIITNGLVAWFDASILKSYPGSGSTWYDLSGNGVSASLINSPTYSENSFTFNGSNQYAITSTITNYRTLSMWVYLNSRSSYLLDARTGSPSGYFWFPGGDAGFGPDWNQFYVNGSLVSTSLTNIPTGQWFNLYIRNTANRTGTINLFSRYTNAEFQAGKYGVFSAYNRELAESEIQQNFNAIRGRYGI